MTFAKLIHSFITSKRCRTNEHFASHPFLTFIKIPFSDKHSKYCTTLKINRVELFPLVFSNHSSKILILDLFFVLNMDFYFGSFSICFFDVFSSFNERLHSVSQTNEIHLLVLYCIYCTFLQSSFEQANEKNRQFSTILPKVILKTFYFLY